MHTGKSKAAQIPHSLRIALAPILDLRRQWAREAVVPEVEGNASGDVQDSLPLILDCATEEVVVEIIGAVPQQTRVYPYPWARGFARPKPKLGARDPENPLFLGFSVLRGGLRPRSQKGPG